MREPRDKKHWPAWVDFNRRVGSSRSDVGIWHETYIVKPGHYEAVYSGMPPYGLGKAANLLPQQETEKPRAPA
jgi:hypothetical protein